MATNSDTWAMLLVVIVALVCRLQFAFRAPMFMQHDSEGYFVPAFELYSGQGFGVGFRRTPTYPLFLSGVLTAFGENLTGIVLVQHVLGAGTALLTFQLGRLTFGRLAGLIAGLLVALNGALIIGEHYLMSEGLFVPLLVAVLLALVLAVRSGRAWPLLGAGALLGLAVLCRPIAQVLYPLIPLAAFALGPGGSLRSVWRRIIRDTLLVALGTLALVGPWTVRNCLSAGECSTTGVMGQAMLARTAYYDRGFVFFDAADPERGPDAPRPAIRRSIQRASDQGSSGGVIARRLQTEFRLSDAETARLSREMALEVIRRQPTYYVAGTLQMFGQLFGGELDRLRTDWKTQGRRANRDEWDDRVEHLLANPTAQQEVEFDRAEAIVTIWQPVYWAPWLPVLSLIGLASALLGRANARGALVYGLAALLLLLAAAAFDGPVARYRYPADPLIALLAAGGTLALCRAARGLFAQARRHLPFATRPLIGSGPRASEP